MAPKILAFFFGFLGVRAWRTRFQENIPPLLSPQIDKETRSVLERCADTGFRKLDYSNECIILKPFGKTKKDPQPLYNKNREKIDELQPYVRVKQVRNRQRTKMRILCIRSAWDETQELTVEKIVDDGTAEHRNWFFEKKLVGILLYSHGMPCSKSDDDNPPVRRIQVTTRFPEKRHAAEVVNVY
jgi:hypothetical protein